MKRPDDTHKFVTELAGSPVHRADPDFTAKTFTEDTELKTKNVKTRPVDTLADNLNARHESGHVPVPGKDAATARDES